MKSATAWLLLTLLAAALPTRADAIPVWARSYRTTCTTCHVAPPKLNVLGEAFRLNGYRFPKNSELIKIEEPIELGAPEWKDLWPRAIWPGQVPGAAPVAVRMQADVQVTKDAARAYSWTYRFPHEVYLLAAGALSDGIAGFIELSWTREGGAQFLQAKLEFQDVITALPPRALNVWLGLQSPQLFTFTERQIDRLGRQIFTWQSSRLAEQNVLLTATNGLVRPRNEFSLIRTLPTLEVNGLAGGRLYYGVGLSQGAGTGTNDDNNHKDLYYKLRYKVGGLRLDGTYDAGAQPFSNAGQLMDRSLILEYFQYRGSEPAIGARQDTHEELGVNARVLWSRLDAGAGYVRLRNSGAWGAEVTGTATRTSLFGRAEYMLFPWLIGSLRAERFDYELPVGVTFAGSLLERERETRVLPALIALVRPNIRAVVEADLYGEARSSLNPITERPHSVWFRLDAAF